MAEDDDWTDEEEGEQVELGAQKAGAAFRAEMWATDFLLNNWMYIVAVIVTGLISVFVYGQYTNHMRSLQLAASRVVAEREVKLPVPVADLSSMLASGQKVDEAKMVEVADALESIDTTGASRCEALVKAAELYRIAGKPEKQRSALEGAKATGIEPMASLATIALANLDLETGNADAAIQGLKTLSARKGYLGEQAAIDLGMMLEHLENTGEARGVYDDFIARFPESPRLELVKKRRAALGEG